MFILGQDKSGIVNYTNGILKIETYSFNQKNETFQIKALLEEDTVILGKYNTEERAKEILLELMKKAEVGNRVYYMPEE